MNPGASRAAQRRLVVATHSAHKLRELRELLRLDGTELVSLDDLGIRGEPIEDGLTFETNARIKARYAGPDATDGQNNAKLLRELAGVPVDRRGARYVCVLALALADAAAPGGLRLIERRGTTRGRVAFEPRGTGGFGYDPLFEPVRERPGGRTFGQYDASEKDAISHRGRAARRMAPVLAKLGF